MRKIPTVLQRDPENRRYVLTDTLTPGCEWVLEPGVVARRKWDGSCVFFDGTAWWARRVVRAGTTAPADFVELEQDPITGHRVGWVLLDENHGAFRWFTEAYDARFGVMRQMPDVGTYELVGPKINGNNDHQTRHQLIQHVDAQIIDARAYWPQGLVSLMGPIARLGWEGLVFYGPQGQLGKLKVRDLP